MCAQPDSDAAVENVLIAARAESVAVAGAYCRIAARASAIGAAICLAGRKVACQMNFAIVVCA